MTAKSAGGEATLALEILERRGVLGDKALVMARELQSKGADLLERALIKAEIVSEDALADAYAQELQLPRVEVDPDRVKPPPRLALILPEKFCTNNMVAPLGDRDGALDLAVVTPGQLLLLDEIQFLTERPVKPHVAPLSFVEKQIEYLFKTGEDIARPSNDFSDSSDAEDDGLEGVLILDEPPPPGEEGRIIRMVNQILEQALRTGASDIHLEPFEDTCKFRLRIDGVLQELPAISKRNFLMVISRFKILAKMDIAERRIPQDGAIAVKSEEKRVDLRVSTVPTVYGEKMVMRILDKGAVPLDLTRLGLTERQSTDLIESIKMPQGLALV
jgi:type IV pilus assembly protein PilB